jgi:hypothetical protein
VVRAIEHWTHHELLDRTAADALLATLPPTPPPTKHVASIALVGLAL